MVKDYYNVFEAIDMMKSGVNMYSLKSNNVYIMSEINNQWILINITDVNNYIYMKLIYLLGKY
jgi:hypothetical protein